MFKNFLKVTVRNLWRHKGYSFINIIGLAIGMACCILILLWIQQELSYDRYHANTDHIYRINKIWRKGEIAHYATTPAPLATTLEKEFPEILKATRIRRIAQVWFQAGEKRLKVNRGFFADPNFLQIFTFPFIKGNPERALTDPLSIVLTEQTSRKIFGDENPVGKRLRFNNQMDFTITGILKNIPDNSHLRFNFLVPFKILDKPIQSDWHNTIYFTYVLLRKESSHQKVNQKIANFLKAFIPDSTSSLYLQPLNKIHLHSIGLRNNATGDVGSITIVTILSFMALFILLIACINFINLSTARFSNRAKEIGMRKVSGAQRTQIFKQFFGESTIFTLIGLILAIGLVEILLPIFNSLSEKNLKLNIFGDMQIIFTIISVTLITSIITGSYPALFLSSVKPVKVLKGILKSGAKSYSLRKILVVCQFFLTGVLIIGTLVIYRQLHFMKHKELGFKKDSLIWMDLPQELKSKYGVIKKEFLKDSNVLNVTASVSLPSWGVDIGTQDAHWPGKIADQEILLRGVGVDYGFIDTFNIKMAQGRSFSKIFPSDSSNYILNETAVKTTGLRSPLGKSFTLMGKKGTIIGVIKDYHFKPLYFEIEPLILRLYEPRFLNFIFIKLNTNSFQDTIGFLKRKWKSIAPNHPFKFQFLDRLLNSLYISEERLGKISIYFTWLAILVACLGLFGLTAFMAEQRTKEIGIRKVIGATVSRIVILISKEFIKLVLIANIIAWPVGYLIANHVLSFYAYKINIGPGIFLFSGIITIIIALVTVSYQAIKAATANPVETLRYE